MRSKQSCQQKGADHLNVLRVEQHLPSIHAVSKDAAHERKEHDRQLSQEQIQAALLKLGLVMSC